MHSRISVNVPDSDAQPLPPLTGPGGVPLSQYFGPIPYRSVLLPPLPFPLIVLTLPQVTYESAS
ncbi:hypothetical protein CVT25_015696 [Psilocybe cyanescens]|uniref:Uncharacterized protein n=1 Tax=Psilocybe cyanescens TaxID=93625 RepID=A0A409XJR2_PSICY|nr:hypothetical protein CVT25_015696 [Psilocybe cyanescens]